MLKTQTPTSGLIFISVLYRSDLYQADFFETKISNDYGPLISFRPQHNPLTKYYAQEMGSEEKLERIFFVTTTTFPREFLLSSKLIALTWEHEWQADGKRMVNIDTGFISAENFILATTKNYAHRIFIAQNIYADLTYQCVSGKYEKLPWTYPDFVDEAKLEFFNWARNFLLTQSKAKTL